MENVLLPEERICFCCGKPKSFAVSRHGCVLRCACQVIDYRKLVITYYERLCKGLNSMSFVPCITAGSTFDTRRTRMVTIECNFTEKLLYLSFNKLCCDEISAITRLLSLSIRDQLRQSSTSNYLLLPFDLLEILSEELQNIAHLQTPFFYTNLPSSHILQKVMEPSRIENTRIDELWNRIPLLLRQKLLPHQRKGVLRAFSFNGRALLADEMGVGKTLQALGVISGLRAYPLLLVCPSILKYMWAEEIERFLNEHVSVTEIHIISGSNDIPGDDCHLKIVIISYHMISASHDWITKQEWSAVICDESHILHTNIDGKDASYTALLVRIGRKAKHCLMLTGTPAPNTVFDIFNQVDTLCPGMLGLSRWDFALQYCRIEVSSFIKIKDCVRTKELISALNSTCLIRRLKNEILELPVKTRIILRVSCAPDKKTVLDTNTHYQKVYSLQWRRKIKGIAKVLHYCAEKYDTFVLFAHHTDLLDELQKLLHELCLGFIRIDGSVLPQARGALLESFSTKKVRVALIGITSCAVGVSLNTASCAVFCELPPDAGWMLQAEDRLHRPGQQSSVTLYYLLGVHSSFDAHLFAKLTGQISSTYNCMDGDKFTLRWGHLPVASSPLTGVIPTCREYSRVAFRPIQDRSLLFLLSKHTGMIHARDTANLVYECFTFDEAVATVRHRSSAVWSQLGEYLQSLSNHSSFQKRYIINHSLWLPSTFHRVHVPRISGSTKRYSRTSLHVGWIAWWCVCARSSSPRYYACALKKKSRLYPRCLGCHRIVYTHCNWEPGKVFTVHHDFVMFCSGKCRGQFFFARSSSCMRSVVNQMDNSICANCHVDCEKLCFLVASQPTEAQRECVVRTHHPDMSQFPALLHRFIEHPIPGNIWHADHIVPVSRGGGQADTHNVQTLCVACHATKTRYENNMSRNTKVTDTLSSINNKSGCTIRTTCDSAVRQLQHSVCHSRVTKRKQ